MNWANYKALAEDLGLPEVVEATSWGNPCLKAHGKLWAWWSPSENAPVFKMSKEEREFLVETASDTFYVTDHYRPHNLVLVYPDKL
ncbi:MAG: MmcQ/YjbR family DNA-binding protein, partial [Salaquimonas sp.]